MTKGAAPTLEETVFAPARADEAPAVAVEPTEIGQLVETQFPPDAQAPEAEAAIAAAAPLDSRPPEKVVKLHVAQRRSGGESMLVFQLTAAGGTVLEGEAPRPRKQHLPTSAARKVFAELKAEVVVPPLKEILHQLRAIRDERADARLIIEEHCESGIPWEMLPFGATRLGGEIPTSRWYDLDDATTRARKIDHGVVRCAGKKRTYVSPDVLSAEKVGHHDGDMDAFVAHLRGEEEDIALVHVLCHGIRTSSDVDSMFLGAREKKGGRQIGYLDLDDIELCRLQKMSLVILLNACGSALAAQPSEYLLEGTSFGFARLFLMKGAKGVIGTLADVYEELAKRFADLLEAEIVAHPHECLAEIIRRLRKRAADAETQGSDLDRQRAREWSYHVHLYVLIGDPRVTVELT